jgi:hypothetical protein
LLCWYWYIISLFELFCILLVCNFFACSYFFRCSFSSWYSSRVVASYRHNEISMKTRSILTISQITLNTWYSRQLSYCSKAVWRRLLINTHSTKISWHDKNPILSVNNHGCAFLISKGSHRIYENINQKPYF